MKEKDIQAMLGAGLILGNVDDRDCCVKIPGYDYSKDTMRVVSKDPASIILDDNGLEIYFKVKEYKVNSHSYIRKNAINYAKQWSRTEPALFYSPLAVSLFYEYTTTTIKQWEVAEIEEALLYLMETLIRSYNKRIKAGEKEPRISKEVARLRILPHVRFIKDYIRYRPEEIVLLAKKEDDPREDIERHFEHWKAITYDQKIERTEEERLAAWLKPHKQPRSSRANKATKDNKSYNVSSSYVLNDVLKKLDIEQEDIDIIVGKTNIVEIFEVNSKEYHKKRRDILKIKDKIKEYFIDNNLAKESK